MDDEVDDVVHELFVDRKAWLEFWKELESRSCRSW